MIALPITQQTRDQQNKASNPSHSIWVSANAGSGKTHVLVSRVIRLLLEGIAPARILCLTFTKAAAANMASRVFSELAGWTQLDDSQLSDRMAAIGAARLASGELNEARKLFARALETPGGLKIQTIHAFCERLLHLFPFEANVPARFDVLDEQGQAELLQKARRAVLSEAAARPGRLAEALEALTEECGHEGFDALIQEAIRQGAAKRLSTLRDSADVLSEALGLPKGCNLSSLEHEMVETGLEPRRWLGIATILDQGKSSDRDRAMLFRQADDAYRKVQLDAGMLATCLTPYLKIFFTKDGDGDRAQSLMTKDLSRCHPELADQLTAEQERLEKLRESYRAALIQNRSLALITVTDAIFQRYREEKALRGVLDFDDLIQKTLAMLDRTDACWVLYRLDAGLDHILVDEAQDTSEAQWKILEELTGDFAAEAGADARRRSFFAVGDEKQSIFSFQGASHQMFGEMRMKFNRRFSDRGLSFEQVRLASSFRSAPGVLAIVDHLFEQGHHKNGVVTSQDVWVPHQAVKIALPSLVEIWPLVKPQAKDPPRDWRLPIDLPDEQDPANVIAERVARKIYELTAGDSSARVHDNKSLQPRPVRPGDILILVRTRNDFFEAVIRALKKRNIPTAGADRLELTQHMAVLDLMAAGWASLLPQDDLTLACVLKSPLVGLDDTDLLALAPERKGSLFSALQASECPRHRAAVAKLAAWRRCSGEGPFTFYAELLGAEGGRHDLEVRLGPEARDPIDEFLRLALRHQESTAPSLASFLAELSKLEYSIKRDMEASADKVRVMTVHGAKGLEAKIVFVPDSCGLPADNGPKIFRLKTQRPGEEVIAWSPRQGEDCETVAQARALARGAAMEEYRRLLYVALTRAEERLYLTGFHGERERPKDCWAAMIEAAFGEEAQIGGIEIEKVPAFWNPSEEILRFVSQGGRAESTEPVQPDETVAFRQNGCTPDWLLAPVQPEVGTTMLLPSQAYEMRSELTGRSMGIARPSTAARRGRLIHQLLQYLPEVPPGERHAQALAFLAVQAPDFDEPARLALIGEALAVIEWPELAPVFAAGSRAEAAVRGQVALADRMIDVSGQVDRISEGPHEVHLADFKAGKPAAEIPPAYLTQMALYRSILAPLWPDKTLQLWLIWTTGPIVVPLPEGMLEDALSRLEWHHHSVIL